MKRKFKRQLAGETDRLRSQNYNDRLRSNLNKPVANPVSTPVLPSPKSTKKIVYCPLCAEAKTGFDAFCAHIKRHIDIAVHVCLSCRKGFLAYDHFLEHEKYCDVEIPSQKCSPSGKGSKAVRVSTVAPVKQFLFCGDCGLKVCDVTPASLPFISSLVCSHADLEAVKLKQRFRKVTIFAEQAEFNHEFEEGNAKDDPMAFALSYISHSKKLPTKCLLCTDPTSEVHFNSPQEILDHFSSAHDLAFSSDSRQNYSSSHGFTCPKCSCNWRSAISFHDHVLNNCSNDDANSVSQGDSIRDFFVSTPSTKAAAPKRSDQNEEVDCDLCGNTYTVATFNKHDCATSFTRRLLVGDDIVKCPAVTPVPCSVVVNCPNVRPDLTIPKTLLKWLSKVVLIKLRQTTKEQQLPAALSCNCAASAASDELVCKNCGFIAEDSRAYLGHLEISACFPKKRKTSSDFRVMMKMQFLKSGSRSSATVKQQEQNSSKLTGVGDEFALTYENMEHDYKPELAQLEASSTACSLTSQFSTQQNLVITGAYSLADELGSSNNTHSVSGSLSFNGNSAAPISSVDLHSSSHHASVVLDLERARKILTLPKSHVSSEGLRNEAFAKSEATEGSFSHRFASHDRVLVPLDQPDHQCVACGETFLSSLRLGEHLQNVHMSFCYQCNQCFVSTELRDLHKLSCTESKTAAYYKCASCEEMFCYLGLFFRHQTQAHLSSLMYNNVTGSLVPGNKKHRHCKMRSVGRDSDLAFGTNASNQSPDDFMMNALPTVQDDAAPDLPWSTTETDAKIETPEDDSCFQLRQLLLSSKHQMQISETPDLQTSSSSSPPLPEMAQLNMAWQQDSQNVRLDSTIDEVVSSVCVSSAAYKDFNSLSLNGFNIVPQSVNNSRSVSSVAASSGFGCDETDEECAIVEEVVLSSEVQRQLTLEQANKRNAERAAHQCDTCKKKFLTSVALKEHMLTHAYDAGVTCEEALPIPVNTTVFVCRICSTAYSSREQFNKHTSRHSTFFSCSECSAIAFNRDQMTRHIAAHKSMAFGCAVCLKAMRSEFSLHTHLALVHSFLLIWMCKPCCFGHQDMQTVVQHIQTEHSELLFAQQSLDPVKVVTQYIAVCTHRKLHYQPSPTEQYVLPSSLPPSHRIPVGECAHRSFQSAQEPVLACKQCGTLIPARTYLLEDAELRQQGNVQLQLVDERLEQTFPIAIVASAGPVQTATNNTALKPPTAAAPTIRPSIISASRRIAQTNIPVSIARQPDTATMRSTAPCTATGAQLNLPAQTLSQRSSTIATVSNLPQLSSTVIPPNISVLPAAASFYQPNFAVSANSMAQMQNFGLVFPLNSQHPQLPLLLPAPRQPVPFSNQQPLQSTAAFGIGRLQPQTTATEHMYSTPNQVVTSVSDTTIKPLAPIAPSVAEDTSVDDILDSIVNKNKFSARKQSAAKNVVLQNSASAEKVVGNGNSAYACDVCREVVASAASLRVHSLRHFPEETFFCLECGSGFRQSVDLTEHMSSNHRSKLNILMDLRCCKCGNKSSSVSEFLSHQYIHNELERCPYCTLRFYSNEAFRRHVAKHSVGKFCCVFCGNCFKTQSETDEHCTSEHFLDHWFMCRECGLCYKGHEQLKEHFEVQHADPNSKGKCVICQENFCSNFLLFNHFRIRHEVKSAKLKRAIRFDEAHDNFVGFRPTPQLIQSEATVKTTTEARTETTTKATTDSLTAEIEADSLPTADVEDDADSNADSYLDIVGHLSSDAAPVDIWLCQVDSCRKTFLNAEEMKAHCKSEKFPCCWQLSLEAPLQNSSRKLPLAICTICDFKTPKRSLMLKHLLRKHNDKGFLPCVECDEHFSDRDDRNYHLLSHGKQVLYPHTVAPSSRNDVSGNAKACLFCSLDFSSDFDLGKHMVAMHGVGRLSWISPNETLIWICTVCGLCKQDESTMALHVRNHDLEFLLGSSEPQQLVTHFGIYAVITLDWTVAVRCSTCSENLNYGSEAYQHFLQKHAGSNIDLLKQMHVSGTENPIKFHNSRTCRLCRLMSFSEVSETVDPQNPLALEPSLSVSRVRRIFRCLRCGLLFPTAQKLTLHEVTTHF